MAFVVGPVAELVPKGKAPSFGHRVAIYGCNCFVAMPDDQGLAPFQGLISDGHAKHEGNSVEIDMPSAISSSANPRSTTLEWQNLSCPMTP